MLLNLVYFIIVLSILIFVHEFGHFLVARIAGVKVLTFSLGFGKKLLTFKKGETEYAISALPLGGTSRCWRIYGRRGAGRGGVPVFRQQAAARQDPDRFCRPILQRAFRRIDLLRHFHDGLPGPIDEHEVGQVMPGEPAYTAGLKQGDIIKRIDGKEVHDWIDLQKTITSRARRRARWTSRSTGAAVP